MKGNQCGFFIAKNIPYIQENLAIVEIKEVTAV